MQQSDLFHSGCMFSLQAQDIDTGAFGTAGIRYSLIGSGNNKYVHCAIVFKLNT